MVSSNLSFPTRRDSLAFRLTPTGRPSAPQRQNILFDNQYRLSRAGRLVKRKMPSRKMPSPNPSIRAARRVGSYGHAPPLPGAWPGQCRGRACPTRGWTSENVGTASRPPTAGRLSTDWELPCGARERRSPSPPLKAGAGGPSGATSE